MFSRQFSTKANAIAVFSNSIWSALLSVIFVPAYLHYLGIESYGLIGIFMTVQAFIVLLDFGLSPTINRELARLSTKEESSQEMLDITRTLEIPNWITAGVIALFLSLVSPLIARYWIAPKELATETVTTAFLIMSVTLAIQFSLNFYMGALMGLQKQVVLSLINILCGTLRSVGALVVIAFVSPTIQAFLIWQGAVVLLQICLMIATLYLSLPSGKSRFQRKLFNSIWRFASGLTGITVIGLILTQTDKVVLSRMLTLENFGYYALAGTVSVTAIGMFVSSISHAIFPQFSRLVSVGNEDALRKFYHQSCQVISVFVFSVAAVLSFYSYEVLIAWVGKPDIAENTSDLLTLIAIGTCINALGWAPYHLQMAHAWTSLRLKMGIVMITVLTPLMIFGAYTYGAVGGAAGWVILCLVFVPLDVHLMHRKILKGSERSWYVDDVLPPLVVSVAVAAIGRAFISRQGSRIELIIELLAVSALTLTAAIFSTKATRKYFGFYKERVFAFFARSESVK